ncbi:hypothetical protein BJV74DRAFT_796666 [Russula compacta]|nr:hypothetical protein BJV74DRAFT_796666 [Russula compacta]
MSRKAQHGRKALPRAFSCAAWYNRSKSRVTQFGTQVPRQSVTSTWRMSLNRYVILVLLSARLLTRGPQLAFIGRGMALPPPRKFHVAVVIANYNEQHVSYQHQHIVRTIYRMGVMSSRVIKAFTEDEGSRCTLRVNNASIQVLIVKAGVYMETRGHVYVALNHVEIDGGFPSLFEYLREDENDGRGFSTPGLKPEARAVQGDFPGHNDKDRMGAKVDLEGEERGARSSERRREDKSADI